MSVRKPEYLVGVTLLASLFSAPQMLLAVAMVWFGYASRTWPVLATVGLHPPLRFNSSFSHDSFWRDGLIRLRRNETSAGVIDSTVSSFDPETGVRKQFDFGRLSGARGFIPISFGPEMWFVEDTDGALQRTRDAYKVTDDELQQTKFAMPAQILDGGPRFLWNDSPAIIEDTRLGFGVSTLEKGTWNSSGRLALPDFSRERMLGGVPINVTLTAASIQVIQSNNDTHLFLHANGLMLHHNGLKIQSSPSSGSIATPIAEDDARAPQAIQTVAHLEGSDSHKTASDTDDDLAGWTLVRAQPSKPDFGNRCTQGLLIDGQPAALIVDDISAGCPTGRLYRFNGTAWTEFNAQPLTFGSRIFRVVTTQDGLRSYVIAMTSTGTAHFYAAEAGGLRQTAARDTDENMGILTFIAYAVPPIAALGLALLLGATTWFLMWRFTRPRYEFGVHTVQLASLGWRGAARLIDLGLICLSCLGLGWLMTRDFDWLALVEAVNLRVEHPMVSQAKQVVAIAGIWLLAFASAMWISQAVWGVTPGKWLCRLKTVRTNLRPCGFAASLAREFVLFVDCGNFVCWTPGLVSIALTERRQRLGDLVADTIVVNSRSLVQLSPTESTADRLA